MGSGQGRHWFIESPKMFHLRVTRPPDLFVDFVFKHIHAGTIYTICWYLFHSFIVLSDKQRNVNTKQHV